eukprot:3708763-Amphidinium_carterae.1
MSSQPLPRRLLQRCSSVSDWSDTECCNYCGTAMLHDFSAAPTAPDVALLTAIASRTFFEALEISSMHHGSLHDRHATIGELRSNAVRTSYKTSIAHQQPWPNPWPSEHLQLQHVVCLMASACHHVS